MRCLVIQTAFLGDVILTVPLLGLLRASGLVEWLGVLATPVGAELVRGQGLADELVEYDKRGRDRGVAGFLRIVRTLRRLEIDTALVPHRSFRSALTALLAGAGRRLGFDESGGSLLLTARVSYGSRPHEAERIASLIEGVGGELPAGRVPFELRAAPADARAVDEILASHGVGSQSGIVAVAPGSRWATKRWLPARFAEAAGAIAREFGLAVVLTGTEADRPAGRAVVARSGGGVLDLTGELSLGEWIALLARARILLSNDSAAAHVAAGVGTPVVAVFGPTVPEQGFAPYADLARVVGSGVECRPCGRHGADRCRLGTTACMEGVRAAAVVEAAREIMSGGRAG